jgi:hypothetical protein
MFTQQDIKLTQDAPVQVQVVVGFAQHCDFDCKLFDTQGNNPQLVFSGSTLASDPPPFVLDVPRPQLIGRFSMTKATIQNLGGNQFSVTVKFSQGGQAIGQIEQVGEITDVQTVTLVARFV